MQDDKDVKQYVKSSLDQSGHMCKYIGILSGTPYTAVTLKLNSGVEFKEIRVELKASQGKYIVKRNLLRATITEK